MITHIEQDDGTDLCPYHCIGCGHGFTFYRLSGPLICGVCKTKHRFFWRAAKGWHLVVIPEAPEGESCADCGFSPCRCEEIIRWSENVPCGTDGIDVQYPR